MSDCKNQNALNWLAVMLVLCTKCRLAILLGPPDVRCCAGFRTPATSWCGGSRDFGVQCAQPVPPFFMATGTTPSRQQGKIPAKRCIDLVIYGQDLVVRTMTPTRLRREYFDQVIFWKATDLARKLNDYKIYYNTHRVHRSLGGSTPALRAGESSAVPAP